MNDDEPRRRNRARIKTTTKRRPRISLVLFSTENQITEEPIASASLIVSNNSTGTATVTTTTTTSTTTNITIHNNKNNSQRRKRQLRRKPRNRRPKYYWTQPQNLWREIETFWRNQVGVVLVTSQEEGSEEDNGNENEDITDPTEPFPSTVSQHSLLIPNERVLNFYARHDIRAAIASQGGREKVQQVLQEWAAREQENNDERIPQRSDSEIVRIMPGRWRDVVEQASQHVEIQQMLENEPALASISTTTTPSTAQRETQRHEQEQQEQSVPTNNVDNDNPQLSSIAQQTQQPTSSSTLSQTLNNTNTNTTINNTTTTTTIKKKWSHNKDQRKPKGYWNLQRVIQELYEYVDGVRLLHGRPAAFMPRPNELTASGRDDLKQAMARFGGTQRICQLARMVPFREWMYVEGQYDLMVQLRQYMDEAAEAENDNDNGVVLPPVEQRYKAFPSASDIRKHGGYEGLYSLIQYYGGRKHVAMRLSMDAASTFFLEQDQLAWSSASALSAKQSASSSSSSSALQTNPMLVDPHRLSYGPFDLLYGIRLLSFVRNEYLSNNPKLCRPPLDKPVILMPTPHKLVTQSTTLMNLKKDDDENNNKGIKSTIMADLIKEAVLAERSASTSGAASQFTTTETTTMTTNDKDDYEKLIGNNIFDSGIIDNNKPLKMSIGYDSDPHLWLHLKTMEFGGYENVARRLGLAFSLG